MTPMTYTHCKAGLLSHLCTQRFLGFLLYILLSFFFFFKTGSHYVALAMLELSNVEQAILEPTELHQPLLPTAGIEGTCHSVQLKTVLNLFYFLCMGVCLHVCL